MSKYVVMFDDGIGYENVFLSFSNEYDDYTSVDYIDEIDPFDIHDTIEDALERAEDAAFIADVVRIVEVLNFDAVMKDGRVDPDLKLVRTLMFHR